MKIIRGKVPMIVKITNDARIKDYRSVLGNSVSIVSGYDEKIMSNSSEISIFKKAKIAGKGFIIEDTTLTINDKVYSSAVRRKDVVGQERAVWTTKMSYHSGSVIHFYEASIHGHIKSDLPDDVETVRFGFIFIPDGYDLNIDELENRDDIGFKNARQLALINLLHGKSYHVEILEPLRKTMPVVNPDLDEEDLELTL